MFATGVSISEAVSHTQGVQEPEEAPLVNPSTNTNAWGRDKKKDTPPIVNPDPDSSNWQESLPENVTEDAEMPADAV